MSDIEPSQITLGNGSDDIFNFVLRAFSGPGDEVIVSQYGFAAYAIAATVVGASVVQVPAVNWGHDLAAMFEAITEKTKVVFIANPNNPTGTWNTTTALKTFLDKVPEQVIVVVDQAYFEYMTDELYPDAKQWLSDYPNLIVTQTFSKAYGLAGFRVGYSVSSPEVADILNRVRLPFNVNALALVAAVAALRDKEHLNNSLSLNVSGLKQVSQAFKGMNLDFIATVGNFITVDIGCNGSEAYQAMLKQGVIVRPLGPYQMPNHLRISIGLEAENERCINVLKDVLFN